MDRWPNNGVVLHSVVVAMTGITISTINLEGITTSSIIFIITTLTISMARV
jgi:hypothetical protein